MKKSIVKQMVFEIGMVTAATLLIILAFLFYTVRSHVLSNETELMNCSLEIARLSVTDFLESNGLGLYDEAFPALYQEEASRLCEQYSIDYLYLYEPDFTTGTLRYILVAGNADTQSRIPEQYRSRFLPTDYDDDTLRVWNGELDRETWEQNDEYGYELCTAEVITDSTGQKAFLGIDYPITAIHNRIIRTFCLYGLVALVITGAVSALLYTTLRKRILTPVQKISASMNEYVAGAFQSETTLQISGADEFGIIASSFNRMTKEIRSYTAHITKLTQERERREEELRIARKIQEGFLPPPDRLEADLQIRSCLRMNEAVGGDLYEYFDLDEDHLCLAIGDVTGHGVTAAMFMGSADLSLRKNSKWYRDPAKILEAMNNDLSARNPENLFITLFVGIFDRRTGTFTYANAGHPSPFCAGETVRTLPRTRGLMLAAFPDVTYTNASVELQAGESLFLYTDGLTESCNAEEQFYGEERLKRCLEKTPSGAEIREAVLADLAQFMAGEPPQDDVTFLTLTRLKQAEE